MNLNLDRSLLHTFMFIHPFTIKVFHVKRNCSDRTFGFPPDSSCWSQTEFNLETAARLHLDLNSCFSRSTFHFQVLSSSPNFIWLKHNRVLKQQVFLIIRFRVSETSRCKGNFSVILEPLLQCLRCPSNHLAVAVANCLNYSDHNSCFNLGVCA